MKSLLISLCLSGILFLFSCGGGEGQSTEKVSSGILITNTFVIDVNTGDIQDSLHVHIDSGKIIKIYDTAPEYSEGMQVIDGTGKFLMPGLSEMHAHIPTPNNGDMSLVEETLFLYLSQGVTTIRGMLGAPFHLELKEMVENGEITSPRVYTSGPSLNGSSVESIEEAESKVRNQNEAGYDFLKLHPGLTMENFDKIVETAKEVGIGFSGHVSIDVGIRHALDSKYGTIDHLDGYLEGLVMDESVDPSSNGFFGFDFTDIANDSLIAELTEMTVDNEVWVVPTHCLMSRWAGPMSPEDLGNSPEMKYMNPSVVQDWVNRKKTFQSAENYSMEKAQRFLDLRDKILLGLYNAGAGIVMGSDAPQVFNVPGFSIHHEIKSMQEAGIPDLEIIKSGTINPAKFFQATDIFGAVEEGLDADLLLLNSNPLDDSKNAKDIEAVFYRGFYLSREEIDQKLEEIAGKYN